MIINICNQEFNTETIKDITITESKVLIDTEEDYFILHWYSDEDIIAAKNYIYFTETTKKDLLNAVNIIVMTCDYYLNSKYQCSLCPLQKKNGCVFTCIPLEWRN